MTGWEVRKMPPRFCEVNAKKSIRRLVRPRDVFVFLRWRRPLGRSYPCHLHHCPLGQHSFDVRASPRKHLGPPHPPPTRGARVDGKGAHQQGDRRGARDCAGWILGAERSQAGCGAQWATSRAPVATSPEHNFMCRCQAASKARRASSGAVSRPAVRAATLPIRSR